MPIQRCGHLYILIYTYISICCNKTIWSGVSESIIKQFFTSNCHVCNSTTGSINHPVVCTLCTHIYTYNFLDTQSFFCLFVSVLCMTISRTPNLTYDMEMPKKFPPRNHTKMRQLMTCDKESFLRPCVYI